MYVTSHFPSSLLFSGSLFSLVAELEKGRMQFEKVDSKQNQYVCSKDLQVNSSFTNSMKEY